MSKIIERIEREAGVPGLVSILAEKLSPTDLQSLLLEVYRLRGERVRPSTLLGDFESNRFVRPSAVSPVSLLGWEQIALSHLPEGFQAMALSPVCPFGTSSAVSSVGQNWAVTTARNVEVVSDSTNVLALECTVRRRDLLRSNPKSSEAVHLAASHRLLRAQHFHSPGSLSHFSSFALCSAGKDQGNLKFELSTLRLHIRFYLRALRAFLGPTVPLHVSIADFSSNAHAELIEIEILSALRSEFEGLEAVFDAGRTKGKGYYTDLCFHIHVTKASGRRLELVDGGSVNWTQKFLSNAKERLVISGIGSERLCGEFGNNQDH